MNKPVKTGAIYADWVTGVKVRVTSCTKRGNDWYVEIFDFTYKEKREYFLEEFWLRYDFATLRYFLNHPEWDPTTPKATEKR